MGREAALGADADTLEGLLAGLAAALGDEVGGLVEALLGGLLVLELAELGADGADDDVLVLGQVLEGLEAAGALRVVLEVEGVDGEVLEQLLGDDVVGALGKVPPADEVAAAQVDARVEVGRQLADRVVVQLDVGVQQVVDGAVVVLVLGPALAELFGAEVYNFLARD